MSVLLHFVLGALLAAGTTARPSPGVEWRVCPQHYVAGAKCGTYSVYENRAARRGRKISLFFVLIPSPAHNVTDAILDLSGGPGEAGTEDATDISAYKGALRAHSLLFADIRGTGRSGGLDCIPALTDPRSPQSYFDEDFFPLANVVRCRRYLEQRADLTQYSTDNAVDDLDDLRGALGFRTVTLSGGSYGTQAAQVYIRRHSDRVRAVLMTSVASMNFKLPLPFARAAQVAIDGVFRACAQDRACHKSFPDPAGDLRVVNRRLAEHAATLRLPAQGQKAMARVAMRRGMFAERLREMLYDPQLSHVIPLLLHLAARGDYQPLGRYALTVGKLISGGLSQGLYLTMTCAEDLRFITDAEIQQETAGTFQGDTRVRAQQRVCKHWHYPRVDPSFLQLVHSRIPALLISGANDPATPPWAAKQVAGGFPNGRVILVAAGTHFTGGPCYNQMDTTFLLTADVPQVRTDCIGAVNRLPFPTTLPKSLP